ncbi:unnamed protein product [Sphagnum troendelagicum]|uniref:Uncharacterized protein n=1 Tax=Sphagnum troendelagicum TaxID=128251 RepID=A0ABP0TIT1_9BRYO
MSLPTALNPIPQPLESTLLFGTRPRVFHVLVGSTTSVDARTEAPGVDGEGRNEVTEARKRDGIKEEWVYMLGGGEGAIWRAFDPVGNKWSRKYSVENTPSSEKPFPPSPRTSCPVLIPAPFLSFTPLNTPLLEDDAAGAVLDGPGSHPFRDEPFLFFPAGATATAPPHPPPLALPCRHFPFRLSSTAPSV